MMYMSSNVHPNYHKPDAVSVLKKMETTFLPTTCGLMLLLKIESEARGPQMMYTDYLHGQHSQPRHLASQSIAKAKGTPSIARQPWAT
jgi:hypothetical protein